jgi:hypothetical protein
MPQESTEAEGQLALKRKSWGLASSSHPFRRPVELPATFFPVAVPLDRNPLFDLQNCGDCTPISEIPEAGTIDFSAWLGLP